MIKGEFVMTRYKLICLDVDGTLYNEARVIPKENIEAIKEAYSRGILICIVTGRMYNYGALYGGKIGIDILTIGSNGAFVKYDDAILNHDYMEEKTLFDMVDILKKYDVLTHYNEWNTLISDRDIGEGNGYLDANSHLPEDRKIEIVITDDLKKTFRERKSKVLKSVSFEFDDKEKFLRLREELKDHPDLEAISSTPFNLEIVKKGVSKARGIEKLIERLGILREEVIAIGDGENDIPMIRYAGMGVAMGNALEEVKAVADMVTDTNDRAGVAKAIRKLCL